MPKDNRDPRRPHLFYYFHYRQKGDTTMMGYHLLGIHIKSPRHLDLELESYNEIAHRNIASILEPQRYEEKVELYGEQNPLDKYFVMERKQ